MAIDRQALQLARIRFDVERYINGSEVRAEGRDEVLLTCPQCRRDKVAVNTRTGFWHCFFCQDFNPRAKGDALGLLMWMEEIPFKEAAQKLIDMTEPATGSNTMLGEATFRKEKRSDGSGLLPCDLPKECLAVDGNMPYLEKRGISLEDAKTFGLGWCPEGWLKNRLVFPVWEGGQCIYWQARAMWEADEHVPRHPRDKFRKTLNPARWRRRGDKDVRYYGSGEVVLNVEQAARYPRVAITEGPTSCIRTGPDAVATFGKQMQPQQIARLVRHGVKAVDFMWDGPSEKEPRGAWDKMVEVAAELAPFMDVRLVFLPAGDPGDYTREQLAYFRAHAVPYRANRTTI